MSTDFRSEVRAEPSVSHRLLAPMVHQRLPGISVSVEPGAQPGVDRISMLRAKSSRARRSLLANVCACVCACAFSSMYMCTYFEFVVWARLCVCACVPLPCATSNNTQVYTQTHPTPTPTPTHTHTHQPSHLRQITPWQVCKPQHQCQHSPANTNTHTHTHTRL